MKRLLPLLLALAPLAMLGACDDETPQPPRDYTLLAGDYAEGAFLSVWAGGPGDVWAAGGQAATGIVLHWNGSAWTRRDPPGAQQLWWVHGFAGGPVFVAGAGGTLMRFDGATGWTRFDVGLPGTTFYGVWGVNAQDMWAVGGPDPLAAMPEGDVVLHFDGTTWTRVRIAALDEKPASAQKDLFKVWGTSATDVFIVGASGMILHHDGVQWMRQTNPSGNEPLFTVYGRAPNDVYAVGGLGSAIFMRYDGATWTAIELPQQVPPALQGLWTAPGQPVHVSGFYGFIAAYDGGKWSVSPGKTRHAFHGLFGQQDIVYAAGGNVMGGATQLVGALAVSGAPLPTP